MLTGRWYFFKVQPLNPSLPEGPFLFYVYHESGYLAGSLRVADLIRDSYWEGF